MTAPNTPLPGRRDGEGTRQKLLRAALELFTGEGFLASTTPIIAERAGVAEGTIYRHFSSKEHLLNEVFRGTQRWATGWSRRSTPTAPSRRRSGWRGSPAASWRRRNETLPAPGCSFASGTENSSTHPAGMPRGNSGRRYNRWWRWARRTAWYERGRQNSDIGVAGDPGLHHRAGVRPRVDHGSAAGRAGHRVGVERYRGPCPAGPGKNVICRGSSRGGVSLSSRIRPGPSGRMKNADPTK